MLENHFCPKSILWHFFDFEHRFFDFYLKITQKDLILPILSRFWLIFASDKRHFRRGSRQRKVSKPAKNGGCKAKRYILCIVFGGDKSFFYKAFRTTTQVENQIFGHEFCNQKFLALNLFERKFVNLKGIAPQIILSDRKAVL